MVFVSLLIVTYFIYLSFTCYGDQYATSPEFENIVKHIGKESKDNQRFEGKLESPN